jgi:3-hydroxyisobutyrate dehydrogenase-like beta-hydroxyacid dehydrogenase
VSNNTVVAGAVIGVAGCGTMGLPMAECLARAGYEVWGYDVRASEEFGAFAPRMICDPHAFAQRVDILISVVRDTVQTFDLCFDRQAMFAVANPPHTLIVSSTLSPRVLPELRQCLAGDVTLIDAPMSGAPHAAREARLSFMLGGPAQALTELMPLFEAMGNKLFRLGPLGAGMTAKVLNNYVACTAALAVRRVYARAIELGTDLEALREVMAGSSGATWFGDNFDAIDWSHQGYESTNTIGILEKDVRSSLDAVADLSDGAPDAFDAALLDALRALEPFAHSAQHTTDADQANDG